MKIKTLSWCTVYLKQSDVQELAVNTLIFKEIP